MYGVYTNDSYHGVCFPTVFSACIFYDCVLLVFWFRHISTNRNDFGSHVTTHFLLFQILKEMIKNVVVMFYVLDDFLSHM